MQTTINHVFVSSSLFFYYYYYILHYWPTYRQSKNKYQCLLNHEELPYFLFLQICSKHYKTAQKQDKIKQTKILTAIGCLFIIEMCIYVQLEIVCVLKLYITHWTDMKVLVVWSRSKAVSTDVQTHYKLQIFRSKNLN